MHGLGSHRVYIHGIHRIKSFVWRASHALREQDQGVPSWSCSQAVSKPVWHIPLLCVQWKIPDDGQRNCAKHVESYSKNKFEKLVHLVGFIPDPARKLSANLYDIYHYCCVYSEKLLMIEEELSETCRVLFQKSIWEFSALVDFVTRIYHNARSPELQIRYIVLYIMLQIHTRNSKCPPPISMHTWIPLINHCHTPSKVLGWLRMVWHA
jgi:hypothetical protein